MTDKEVIDTLRGLVDMESLKPHQRIAIKEAVRRLAEVEQLQLVADMAEDEIINLRDINQKIGNEREKLRHENTAMQEIVQAVTQKYEGNFGLVRDAVLCYNENADRYECPWCYGRGEGKDFQHTPDCPVTKARAILEK